MQMQVETADLIFMVIAYLSWREREGEVGIIFLNNVFLSTPRFHNCSYLVTG